MWEEQLSTIGMHLMAGGEEGLEGEPEFECEEEEAEPHVVLFTFFMLLVGLLTLQFLRKVPVPYTAQLLIIGLCLGFLHKELSHLDVEGESGIEGGEGGTIEGEGGEDEEGSERKLLSEETSFEEYRWHSGYDRLGIGLQIWTGMSPELLLLLFLPALIFASAFSLQFHIIKRVFWQVLLLAGPGVVIGTGMVAVFAKYVFPYDWCWPKALMFGAMLSATDPVAVVALLKEVGASAKLGHVIEGESLFNDGTAFVFFLLFRDMIPVTADCFDDEAETFVPHCSSIDRDLGESIRFFARLALGGPALGIGCGIVATLWIKCVFNNIFVEISLTFVSAYLTFYLAEDVVEVSGVLAVVALGIFMSTFARDSVSSAVHEPMHVFWEMMEYFANTMVFVYTGVKVALEIYEQNNSRIQGSDWALAILLYVVLNVARALTVAILYPIMVNMGYGLTLKDSIVMVWGGLRGAVGLALALIVELDENKLPGDFRALTIFYMGTMAASTLIINGTSMPYLLKMLGTTKTSPEKLEVLLHVIKDMEDCDASQLEYDPLLGDADTETILKIAKLDVSKIIPKTDEVQRILDEAAEAQNPALVGIGEQLSHRGLSRRSAPGAMQSSVQIAVGQAAPVKKQKWWWPFGKKATTAELETVTVTQDMLVKDLRSRFFQGVKASYAEWLEEGIIKANQVFDLREATDKSLDLLGEKIADWDYLKTLSDVPAWRVYLHALGGYLPFDLVRKPLQRALFDGVEHSVLCARALIHAHTEAESAIADYIKIGKKNSQGAGVLQKLTEAGEIVINESRVQSEDAQGFVKSIKQAYPEITRSIKTKMVAQHILLDKLHYVENLHKAGLIEAREAEGLETLIAKKMKKLAFHPPKLDLPEAKDLLHSHPLFSDISRSVFEGEVMPHARHKVYQPKTEIFSLGGIPQHVTLVVQGMVQVILPDGKPQRQEGTGAILGMSEVLLGQHRGRTLVAETVVSVYQIEAEVFLGLVARHVGLWRRAWQMAGAFLTVFHPWGEYKGMSYQQVQTIFRNAKVHRFKKNDEFTVENTALLMKGKVREVKLDGSLIGEREAPEPLGPGPAYFVCSSSEVFIAKIQKTVQRRSVTGDKLKRISMVHGHLSTVSLTRTVAEQALSLPRNSLNMGHIPEEQGTAPSPPVSRGNHNRADSAPVNQMADERARATIARARAHENSQTPRN